jgi:mono/diheme cytochrome c family protein
MRKFFLEDSVLRIKKSILIVLSVLAFFGCSKPEAKTENPVERGKYLVTLGGCNDCHTPKVAGPNGAPVFDTSRTLSGHPRNAPVPSWSVEDERRGVAATTNGDLSAWAGPWGVSFAMNLTPDRETGIAEWSEQMFIQVARTGKHQGQPNGRDILPPMPWFSLKDLTDADLKAIWAYLRSLPPIQNQVPFPIPPKAAKAGQTALK